MGNSPGTGEFPPQMARNAKMFPFDDVIMFCYNGTWGLSQYQDGLTRYADSHYKDKMVVRLSYLCNGNSYTDNCVFELRLPHHHPTPPRPQHLTPHPHPIWWNSKENWQFSENFIFKFKCQIQINFKLRLHKQICVELRLHKQLCPLFSGMCVCDDPWNGSSCAVNLNDPPTVSYLPQEGLCNLNDPTRNCTSAVITGENFLERSTLTCHIMELSMMVCEV